MPMACRFSTISSPMKPAPATTARRTLRSAIHSRMRRTSGMFRKVRMPGRSIPGSGGLTGDAPGESTSAS